MKKYTQADFDDFEVDEFGYKVCPTGDYTAIKSFDGGYSFGKCCSFGEGCSFGECCRFGEYCSFGEGCSFGECCRFGEYCSFGEGCNFEDGAVKNGRYVAVDRIGSKNQKVYFYADENDNLFVRAGCWFSDMEAFKERVKEVHAGTIREKTYLAACELAELALKGEKMNKAELMRIAQRYNMEFVRDEITREGCGVYGTFGAAVPELDKIVDDNELPVVGRRTYDADSVTYTIFCPRAWIDLWGWR